MEPHSCQCLSMRAKEVSVKNQTEQPVAAVVGVVASLIAIFIFLTGFPDVPAIYRWVFPRPPQSVPVPPQPPMATRSVVPTAVEPPPPVPITAPAIAPTPTDDPATCIITLGFGGGELYKRPEIGMRDIPIPAGRYIVSDYTHTWEGDWFKVIADERTGGRTGWVRAWHIEQKTTACP